VDNRQIAATLEDLANLYALAGGTDFYRERALRTAAESVRGWPESVEVMCAEGRLTGIHGVGPGIAARIAELCRTGKLAEYESLRAEFPPSLSEVLQVPGMGVKSARRLYDELGVEDLATLEEAALDGRLGRMRGFSAKKVEAVLAGIAEVRAARPAPIPLPRARAEAERLLSRVRAVLGDADRIAIAGEVRRQITVVTQAILVVATQQPERALDEAQSPGWAIVGREPRRLRLRSPTGVPVDVIAVAPDAFGAALIARTGAPAHFESLRARAAVRGLRLDEDGLFDAGGARVPAHDEDAIYAALELPPIAPELRDGEDEIDCAASGLLPSLVTLADLRGDLHAHTVASDGTATLRQMAETAKRLGREYLAITDHSQSLTIARGLSADELRAQWRELREVEAEVGIRLLRGVEADILEDGAVDLGPELLASLDVVVASLHSHLRMGREEMTRRVVRALESDLVDVMGHPSTRKLGGRAEIDVDWDAVFAAARAHGVALEVNCLPDRLDLDGALARRAIAAGCHVAISTDSHSTAQLAALPAGLGQARRGRVPAGRVITALPVEELLDRFAAHHPHLRARARPTSPNAHSKV
jgi:DNA polymerase (family 10)